MAFSDHFVGVPQSRWAGYAILAAVVAVALAILFGKDHIPMRQRVLVIVIMFLLALPTIAIVLFQLTCLVTGTSKAPYCGWYAWIIAAFTILYCILLIIVAITVKSTDEYAKKTEKFVSFDEANKFAKGLLKKGGFEMFEDMPEKDEAEEKEGFAEEVEVEEEEPVEAFAEEADAKMKKVEKFSTASMPKVAKKDKDDKETEAFADYAPVSENPNMYML